MDLSQPPPGYALQQKLMVPPGMMMKPPPSPLEDGEHASSDADERMGYVSFYFLSSKIFFKLEIPVCFL